METKHHDSILQSTLTGSRNSCWNNSLTLTRPYFAFGNMSRCIWRLCSHTYYHRVQEWTTGLGRALLSLRVLNCILKMRMCMCVTMLLPHKPHLWWHCLIQAHSPSDPWWRRQWPRRWPRVSGWAARSETQNHPLSMSWHYLGVNNILLNFSVWPADLITAHVEGGASSTCVH